MRTSATVIWAILILATAVSWYLGAQHGTDGHTLASVAVLIIAMIKVRFVGLYFMELRDAPAALRGLFEGDCVVVCAMMIGVFLFA